MVCFDDDSSESDRISILTVSLNPLKWMTASLSCAEVKQEEEEKEYEQAFCRPGTLKRSLLQRRKRSDAIWRLSQSSCLDLPCTCIMLRLLFKVTLSTGGVANHETFVLISPLFYGQQESRSHVSFFFLFFSDKSHWFMIKKRRLIHHTSQRLLFN